MQFGDSSDSESEEDDPEVVSRAEWNARPALRVREFSEPPTNAVYSETETKSCKTKDECVKLIQEIQNYHIDVRGLPDIQYNFIIGGDGNVYEGRGWHYIGNITSDSPQIPSDTPGNIIEIAFVGNYTNDAPPNKMLKLAAGLIQAGIRLNKLLITKKTDKFLSREEVEEMQKKGKVEIRGYNGDGSEFILAHGKGTKEEENEEEEKSVKNAVKTRKDLEHK